MGFLRVHAEEDVKLNGFSASGNFADRFTALHPERVLSVTAGGLNGMALLPHEVWNDHTLDYHVGIADLEEITGDSIEVDKLNDVNQLLYMGSDDTNDTIPYDDAWSEELRELALSVYGDDMIEDRFPRCQAAYDDAGIEAQFKIYMGVGHRPAETSELVEFHRRSINEEDVSDFGDRLGIQPDIQLDPTEPQPGEEITFDATGSEPNIGELVGYMWDFDDGGTGSGEVATHVYGSPGSYQITLEVISDQGTTKETTREVVVGSGSSQPSIVDYAAEDTGVVESEGVQEAFGDWRGGDIETDLLQDVFDYWRRGVQVK